MLVASTSVFGFHCTTPAASSWRTPPWRPRVDFAAAMERALRLARSEEAEYLPGWCGPNP
jgi:hypothetical protein